MRNLDRNLLNIHALRTASNATSTTASTTSRVSVLGFRLFDFRNVGEEHIEIDRVGQSYVPNVITLKECKSEKLYKTYLEQKACPWSVDCVLSLSF